MQHSGKFKFPIVVGAVIALLLVAGAIYMTTMYLNTYNKKSTPAKSAKPALVAPKAVQNSLKSANDAATSSNNQLGSAADAFNEKQVKVSQ